MADELTYVFGYNDSIGAFSQYPSGNVVIRGALKGHRAQMLHNIVDSLVLRYSEDDILLSMYEGCSVISALKENVLYVENLPNCTIDTCSTVMLLSGYIHRLMQRLTLRIESVNRTNYEIALMNITTEEFKRLCDTDKQLLQLLLKQGRSHNMFLIIACEDDTLPTYYQQEFMESIYLIPQYILLQGDSASMVDQYLQALVTCRQYKPLLLSVHVYDKQTKKDIAVGKLKPNNATIDVDRLKNFALLYNIKTRGDNKQ